MEGRLSCLLPRGHVCLLLVVAVGGALSQGGMRCLEATAGLGKGGVRSVANGTRYRGGDYRKTLYLWPREGFRGVGLQALADNGTGTAVRLAAWFSKDRLFPAANNTDAWWELWVRVLRGSDRVVFRVGLGDGAKACVSRVTIDNLQGLEVVGYGPSRWRDTPPPAGCPYQGYYFKSRSRLTCTAPPPIPPPTPSPPIPPPTPSPPDALVVAALVSVLVVVVTAVVDIILSVDMSRTLKHRVAHQNAA